MEELICAKDEFNLDRAFYSQRDDDEKQDTEEQDVDVKDSENEDLDLRSRLNSKKNDHLDSE